MIGVFFKSVVRKTLTAVSSPVRRRRTIGLRTTLEGLETRAMLSGVGSESPVAAEICVINVATSAPADNDEARKARRAFDGLSITGLLTTGDSSFSSLS
jgi:hypothetical protein